LITVGIVVWLFGRSNENND